MSDYGDVNDFQSAKNQIHFKVDNQTSFDLEPQEYYAYFGNFEEEPSEIQSNSSGSGGHLVSSRNPFGGTTGMVGYKIIGGSETLYLRFLATNPYMSAKDNTSISAILDNDAGINQSNYKSLEKREEQDDTRSFHGGTLKVTSAIGQADDATAFFTITFEE
ncbi:hypothetical protein BDV39DRAFT_181705 [Aspergillus sergii]|uniref:Uncharacterized protein n=1 Tax=Aspergillus sergii TaxID=1034303 RepID=A0A5N6WV59_9EURO|nr:hypothetical protein BDV39DRAFT_181705 [Aspergillus sergii]